MSRSATLLVAAFASACACTFTPLPAPEPEPPTPAPTDGGMDPMRPETCRTACDNQRVLECELGETTPEGSTCEDVCKNIEDQGIESIRWKLPCLTNATNCEECQ